VLSLSCGKVLLLHIAFKYVLNNSGPMLLAQGYGAVSRKRIHYQYLVGYILKSF
jgi:hypothetical protein